MSLYTEMDQLNWYKGYVPIQAIDFESGQTFFTGKPLPAVLMPNCMGLKQKSRVSDREDKSTRGTSSVQSLMEQSKEVKEETHVTSPKICSKLTFVR